jgi:hypothetical protein
LRVYLIDKDHQPTDIDVAELASRFSTWLTDDANSVLSEIIWGWLQQPPENGGLGALDGTIYDIALLRAEVIANWAIDEEHVAADLRAGR